MGGETVENMSKQKGKILSCDQCGKAKVYNENDCIEYLNTYGKTSLKPSREGVIVLSLPISNGREYFDFCSVECLKKWVADFNAK